MATTTTTTTNNAAAATKAAATKAAAAATKAAATTTANIATTTTANPGNVAQAHHSNPKANAYTRYIALGLTQLVKPGPHMPKGAHRVAMASAIAQACVNGPQTWATIGALVGPWGAGGAMQQLRPHVSYLTGYGVLFLA